ncbi:MAG: DUF4912 domain-containing protein [Thermoguttaceae bacterium]
MSTYTLSELNQLTVKKLATVAKELGIAGCSNMRKEELLHAIQGRTKEMRSKNEKAQKAGKKERKNISAGAKNGDKLKDTAVQKKENSVNKKEQKSDSKTKKSSKLKTEKTKSAAVKNDESKIQAQVRKTDVSGKSNLNGPSGDTNLSASKTTSSNLNSPSTSHSVSKLTDFNEKIGSTRAINGVYDEINGGNKDRFILMVRDPFWLHVYWELCSRLIERAKAAMGHSWHTAVPVLRLFRIEADGVNNPRREVIRDIRIHNGANNWYVDVSDPPGTFQVEIGFLSRDGNFFPIASSNIVQTPLSQVVEGTTKLDGHWGSVSEDFDRIFKLSGGLDENNKELKSVFEEQLQRSMSLPLITRFGAKVTSLEKTKRNFDFNVEADIILHGKTDPSVQIGIKGEPIRVASDGSFAVRYTLSEKRQVFPIDAKSSDGIETQQVIVAIERNTKVLETVFLENDEED